MKNLILALTMLVSTMAISAPSAERLAKRKAMIIERISMRIDSLEKNKSCINSASTKDDFKECRTEHKSRMKSLRAKFKSDRASRKAEREARKAKKNK